MNDRAGPAVVARLAFGQRLCVMLAIMTLAMLPVSAQVDRNDDRVTVLVPAGGDRVTVTGTVIDWTGKEIQIRSGDGVRQYPAERVIDVQAGRLAQHVEGQRAFAARNFDEAERAFRAALSEEPRTWMRREILAEQTRLALAQGSYATAGTAYLSLMESDPDSRHFPLIPLQWRAAVQNEPNLLAMAVLWLRSTSELSRLVGASHLQFHPQYDSEAKEVLDRLSASLDRRIFPLARAQVWRRSLESGNVSTGELSLWENRVSEFPERLRGGPRYLIGIGWIRGRDPERAAASLLWLPLVYDIDQPLAAEAELQAAGQLLQIGRSADAIVLLREIMSRFEQTASAPRAEVQLKQLAEESRGNSSKISEPSDPPS